MNIDFGVNQTLVEVIKNDAFRGTYFRDIYSGINGKWYERPRKESDAPKNIDQNYYCSNYYDASVNKYRVKCGTSFRFWENKVWINPIILFFSFRWYSRYWLGRSDSDD